MGCSRQLSEQPSSLVRRPLCTGFVITLVCFSRSSVRIEPTCKVESGALVSGMPLIRSRHDCEIRYWQPRSLSLRDVLSIGPKIHDTTRSLATNSIGHLRVICAIALLCLWYKHKVYGATGGVRHGSRSGEKVTIQLVRWPQTASATCV